MHNPVKGEGVVIEIDGKEYPLVFTYDAIAKIEAKYDQVIADVQTRLPRVDVMLDLLNAALVGYKGELGQAEIPPLIATQMLLQKALYIAYYGVSDPDKQTEDAPKDDGKKK